MPTIWPELRRTAKSLLRTLALGKKEVFRQSLSFQVLYSKAFYNNRKNTSLVVSVTLNICPILALSRPLNRAARDIDCIASWMWTLPNTNLFLFWWYSEKCLWDYVRAVLNKNVKGFIECFLSLLEDISARPQICSGNALKMVPVFIL